MPLLPSGPRGAFVPAAPKYNGRSRDWMTDAAARPVSLHPIDSGVQLAMAVQKGELTSSKTTGNDLLSSVTDLGGQRQHEQVVASIQRAQPIARYLQEGSITIISIADDFHPQTGALLVTINYRNELTGKDEVARNSQP